MPDDLTQGEPFSVLATDLDALAVQVRQQVSSLEERLSAAESRPSGESWWHQRIFGIPSWLLFGAVGTMALLGWWRSRK